MLILNRSNNRIVRGILSVVKGGCILCADYYYVYLQNAYCKGYIANVEVTNILVINFFGEIIHTGVNFPLRWYDRKLSNLSGFLFLKLGEEMIPII